VCGRFTLTRPTPKDLIREFEVLEVPPLEPRFNIAPTQPAPIVRKTKDGAGRELVLARFGLIPHWAPDPKTGYKMINARAESVMDRPGFREAFQRKRCLVPADGFFEWQRLGERKKQPYWIGLPDHQLFAFAGLWARWRDPEGNRIDSFAILTTEPNALVGSLHDRMPVILERDNYALWLDPGISSPEILSPLLRALPADRMVAMPVGTRVNNVAHDDPACVEPAPAERQGSLF
jgi:putative SOS response-associated peptidase YedK